MNPVFGLAGRRAGRRRGSKKNKMMKFMLRMSAQTLVPAVTRAPSPSVHCVDTELPPVINVQEWETFFVFTSATYFLLEAWSCTLDILTVSDKLHSGNKVKWKWENIWVMLSDLKTWKCFTHKRRWCILHLMLENIAFYDSLLYRCFIFVCTKWPNKMGPKNKIKTKIHLYRQYLHENLQYQF